jgi:hypothetical protein
MQFVASGEVQLDTLVRRLLQDAQRSLAMLITRGGLDEPAEARLPFRELGLAIGLRSIKHMRIAVKQRPDRFEGSANAAAMLVQIESLARFTPISDHVEQFWLDPISQRSPTWTEHLDINSVMLATSLMPEEYLASSRCSAQTG